MFHCCCTQCHLVSFCCASEQRRRFSAAWESCKSAGWSKVTKWGALLLLPPEPQLLEEKNSPQKQRSILHSKTVPAWSASYKSSPKLPFFFLFLKWNWDVGKKKTKHVQGRSSEEKHILQLLLHGKHHLLSPPWPGQNPSEPRLTPFVGKVSRKILVKLATCV